MSNFKIGDIIVCTTKAKMKDEINNWAKEEGDGLIIGNSYTVNEVSDSGWVSLDGLKY